MNHNVPIDDVIERTSALAVATVGVERAAGPTTNVAAFSSTLPISYLPSAQPTIGAKSPCGITGDKLTQVQLIVDWFNGTFPAERTREVEAFISKWVGPFQIQTGGTNTYHQCKRSSSKAVIAWSDGRKEAWLSLNGDSCDLIPGEVRCDFFAEMNRLGVKCTRLDLAADFCRNVLSLSRVHYAATHKQVRGYRRYDLRKPMKNMQTHELEGNQASFGRRGSDGSGKYVRFYDKALESKGQIDAIRFECEFSGLCAGLVFEDLCEAGDLETMRGIIARRLGGCIDFVKKDGTYGHRDRQVRLPWWQRVVDLLGTAPIAIKRTKTCLQRAAESCKLQYSKSMAKIKRVAELDGKDGRRFVHSMVDVMLLDGQHGLEESGWQAGLADTLNFESLIDPKRFRHSVC